MKLGDEARSVSYDSKHMVLSSTYSVLNLTDISRKLKFESKDMTKCSQLCISYPLLYFDLILIEFLSSP